MAIYYLDIDDEITFAAQRIRESGDSRIALVVQSGSRVASSRINFKLLAREAHHRGRRLAIVAADASVRALAEASGLPVFGTVAEYQKSEGSRLPEADEATAGAAALGATMRAGGSGSIRSRHLGGSPASESAGAAGLPVQTAGGSALSTGRDSVSSRKGSGAQGKPTARRRRRTGLWLALGVAGAVAATGLSAYLLLPAASVVLTLRSEPLGPVTFTALVDPGAKSPSEASNVVPAVLRELDVKAGSTFNATGENVLETAAIGKVTFSSGNTVGEVPVLAGTQVSTAKGVVFTTTANVTVPKAKLNGLNLVPGTAEAGVVAVVKGTGGNVAAASIVKVPPDLAAFLVLPNPVTNKAATTGGTHSVSLFIQQADIDAAEEALITQLETAFQARLGEPSVAGAGMQMFAPGARLDDPVFEPDPKTLLGLEQDRFNLTASGTGSALSASTVSLRELATARMADAAKPGFAFVDGSVTLALGESEVSGNAVSVVVTARGLQAPAVDEARIRAAIGGMSPVVAETYLARYGKAEVSVWPFWVSTVPDFLDFRIEIRVLTPTPAPSAPSATATASATTAP